MKKILFFILPLFFSLAVIACPACEKQQPKILRGITHGTGPEGKWDYMIIAIALAIVLICLFFSAKWLIRPGEQGRDHIKRQILNPE